MKFTKAGNEEKKPIVTSDRFLRLLSDDRSKDSNIALRHSSFLKFYSAACHLYIGTSVITYLACDSSYEKL